MPQPLEGVKAGHGLEARNGLDCDQDSRGLPTRSDRAHDYRLAMSCCATVIDLVRPGVFLSCYQFRSPPAGMPGQALAPGQTPLACDPKVMLKRGQAARRLGKSVATVRRMEGNLLRPARDEHAFQGSPPKRLKAGVQSER